MLVDINNILKLNKFARCKGCSDGVIKRAIKKKKLNKVVIDNDTFIILDSKAYLYRPKRQTYPTKPLPSYKEPFFVDTDDLFPLTKYALMKKLSYKEIFKHVVYQQRIPHVRIDNRIFIVVNEEVILTSY